MLVLFSGIYVILKCPHCDTGKIDVRYTPPLKRSRRESYGRSHSKDVIIWDSEKYEVLEDCPECGKKASEIERVLNKGEEKRKPPSNKEILRRLKEAGLPTKVGGKKKNR